jgi:hypothetical protein
MRGEVRGPGLLYQDQASYQSQMSSMTHSSKGVTRIPPCRDVDSRWMEVAVSGGVRSGVELSVLSSYGHIIAIRKLLPFDQDLLHRSILSVLWDMLRLAVRLV